MEGKDNRSREKRSKMKQHSHRKGATQRNALKTSSSSTHDDTVRAVIDVADSSDDHRFAQQRWGDSRNVRQNRLPDLDYDFDEDDEVNAQMRAGDFKQLSQMPTSVGGHFKFSSEKSWESMDDSRLHENSEASKYFTLNLKLLNAGLKTIPFYKRLDYPSALFSPENILKMEKEAELAEENYQVILKEQNIKSAISTRSRPQSALEPNGGTENVAPQEATADELDDLLNASTAQIADLNIKGVPSNGSSLIKNDNSSAPTAGGGGTNEDIQQWLDSVLEE